MSENRTVKVEHIHEDMHKKTRFLAITGVLTALHVVLGYFSIDLGNLSISLGGLPVMIAGLFFGAGPGLCVGLLGSLITQLIKYGITATTFLWILPSGLLGLIAGTLGHHAAKKGRIPLLFVIFGANLLVTLFNTVILYADSKIYGYYSFAYIFGAVPVRILSGLLRAVLYTAVIWPIYERLRKTSSF